MKQFHNEFNNESHYSGDLVKEIQVLQNEYTVTKAKLDICDAAFDKVNSGSSSGVALRTVDAPVVEAVLCQVSVRVQ